MALSLQGYENLVLVNSLVGLAVTAAMVRLLYKGQQDALATKNGVPLPPGPPARWFWENAMPEVNIAHTLTEWIQRYGAVISLRQGSQVTIVIGRMDVRILCSFLPIYLSHADIHFAIYLGSPMLPRALSKAAIEIMEKESSALVDRPRWVAAGEILSQGMRILLAGAGERFRRLRKAVHSHLQPKAAQSYRDLQLEHAKDVITDILNDPKNHQDHLQRYAASVILRVTYGKSTPTSSDDPEVVREHLVLGRFLEAVRPGAHLVDRIPLLKYIPGYGSKLKRYREFELQFYTEQLERVEGEMKRNAGGNSFVQTLLDNVSQHQLSRDEMAYLSGSLFGAATGTTVVAVTTMIMAAARHPQAQKRVQDELDLIVGMGRMPDWEDSDQLPQLHAFLQEALRWRPVMPIGFPHRATQDIVWRGQCIPAGATVYGCHWAISRDPDVFPNPEEFDPQRWLNADGQIRKDMHSDFYTYGFGRRFCPGEYIANQSMYINLALLLWSFRILERPDAPIDIDAYTDTVVAHPAPFEVNFVPRVEESQLREMMANSSL